MNDFFSIKCDESQQKTLTRYIGVARILLGGGGGEAKRQITGNDVIRIFRKEELFTGQRYSRMEDQKPEPGLACNLGFAKEKELEPKVKKISKVV